MELTSSAIDLAPPITNWPIIRRIRVTGGRCYAYTSVLPCFTRHSEGAAHSRRAGLLARPDTHLLLAFESGACTIRELFRRADLFVYHYTASFHEPKAQAGPRLEHSPLCMEPYIWERPVAVPGTGLLPSVSLADFPELTVWDPVSYHSLLTELDGPHA
jgi:hypothetical protein